MDINQDMERLYDYFCSTKSDFHRHMPTIRSLGEEVNHITEFGVRYGVSTLGWLISKPKTFICYDIINRLNKRKRLSRYTRFAKENDIEFKFIVADDLKIEIEPTELLFVDTLHTYEHVKEEIKLHANNVSKYLVFHDTEGTYGNEVRPAIDEFLENNNTWNMHMHYTYNNGLTILKKQQLNNL